MIIALIFSLLAQTVRADYCTASGSDYYEYIRDVVVGDINNSGTGCDHYTDYTAMSTDMEIGTGYEVTVVNGEPWEGDQCGIWVDWNQDKDFDDPDETIAVTGNPGDGPYTATITPPADANLGETRMRIRIIESGDPEPCGNTTYGEVEDYTINVVSGGYCNASGGGREYIRSVWVSGGSIINLETGSDGYADYTAISTQMNIGQDYSITVGESSYYPGDQCGMWVDWNQDDDFYDTGEEISVGGNPTLFKATITPPAGAVLGSTRLRIRLRNSGELSPCGNTTYGEVEDYTINVVSGGYCSASGGCENYIKDVKVGAIENTGTGCDGYADYTSLSTTMGIENSYLITLLKGSYSWQVQCSIWVDWNQDEDFDDPGEEIIGNPNFTSFSAVITPPADAELGDTRMRIRIIEGTPEPCGQTDNGEVEDYTITVTNTIPGYCMAVGGMGFCGGLTNFQLKTIDNSTSGCERYADYTSISTELEIGTGYPVFVVTDGGNSGIWVDWNQDLDFDDADEQIDLVGFGYKDPPYGNTTIFTNNKIGGITPPEGAALGATRLRLRVAFGDLSPCGVTDDGEVEDYTVIIAERGQSGEEPYGGGQGTEQEPFLIYTAEQMQAIGENNYHWAKHFKLMADVDLEDVEPNEFNIIGNYIFNFTGVFDGNGHTISNFTYSATDEHRIGIFGEVSDNAVIKNLGLVDPNVQAQDGQGIGALAGILKGGTISNCCIRGGHISGQKAVGGLIGGNHATVENCYSATTVTGDTYIGGLVGFQSNGGQITDSYSSGNVSGNSYTGGLIGYNKDDVFYCYSIGDVSGSSYVGGLIGYNSSVAGNIENCYAKGDVSGNDRIGGLVGANSNNIKKCYSAGSVSGNSNIGGLIGVNSDLGTHVRYSYWDTQTCLPATSSDGGTGRTTIEMVQEATFTNWDFVTPIWKICEGTNYPKLAWQIPAADFLCPDGVDLMDYSYFSGYWMNDNCSDANDCDGSDLDLSGTVGIADLEIFCGHWLEGTGQ